MPPTKNPTVYDVAKRAGVSIATVSRVLNNPELVREATRSKVLTIIDELGFIPKAEASARARAIAGRIGLITPFFTFPSFVQRMRGVTAALAKTPYELTIYPVNSLDRLEGYLAMLPITRRLDGLIILSLPIDDLPAQRLVTHGLETVLVEFAHPSFSSVVIDQQAGGKMAAEYLIKKGHRRLAFVGSGELPKYSLHPEDSRLEGFRNSLDEHDVSLTVELINTPSLSNNEVRQVFNRLMELPDPPTAIFAASDDLAIRLLRAARENGLTVPKDLAIIGFDNIDMAEQIGLTTIDQSLDDSGRMAAEQLLARMENPSRPLQSVQIKLRLVERDTA